MKKLKCWDAEEEIWIYEGEENEFTYHNGKWKVRYTVEKNMMNGDIEIDAPVWVYVEDPKIYFHYLHDTNIGFYISIPLNTTI